MMSIHLLRPDGSMTTAVYPDKDAALKAAIRAVKRFSVPLEVVWCKYPGEPKVWLARVAADGTVSKTSMWSGDDPLSRYHEARRLAVARFQQVIGLNSGKMGNVPDHLAEALVKLMVAARDKAIAARHALYQGKV